MVPSIAARLRANIVVSAHPLALDAAGAIDQRAQRALTRYYLDSGVHGLAVGVHTTQFDLHADRGALAQIWELAATEAADASRDVMLIAGLTGDIDNAVAEAERAAQLGYEAVLLCPYGMSERTEDTLIERARAVGEILPTIGFYLQDSVGGMRLSPDYWKRLFDLESTVAVKAAPFDRYRTADVAQSLLSHDRWNDIALLTGNDDAIVHDLITPYRRTIGGVRREVRASGGLLGQWAVGARAAVSLVHAVADNLAADRVTSELLAAATDLVDINAAVFDVDNNFAGCVAGVNEVLRQQGLLTSSDCLGGSERLSPGQSNRIAAVRQRYPELLDEEFIAAHVDRWLA